MGVLERAKKTPEEKSMQTRQEHKESSNLDVEMAHSSQDSEHSRRKVKGKWKRRTEKEARVMPNILFYIGS